MSRKETGKSPETQLVWYREWQTREILSQTRQEVRTNTSTQVLYHVYAHISHTLTKHTYTHTHKIQNHFFKGAWQSYCPTVFQILHSADCCILLSSQISTAWPTPPLSWWLMPIINTHSGETSSNHHLPYLPFLLCHSLLLTNANLSTYALYV